MALVARNLIPPKGEFTFQRKHITNHEKWEI